MTTEKVQYIDAAGAWHDALEDCALAGDEATLVVTSGKYESRTPVRVCDGKAVGATWEQRP